MSIPNTDLVSRYLASEASSKSDWLRLSVMLLLLAVARHAQPLPAHGIARPAPTLSRYLLPAKADSSRFSVYDARYQPQFVLGWQNSY